MGLLDLLKEILEKIKMVLTNCDKCFEELKEAEEVAEEIKKLIDEWLKKVEEGVAGKA